METDINKIASGVDILARNGCMFCMPGMYGIPSNVFLVCLEEAISGSDVAIAEYHKIRSFEQEVAMSATRDMFPMINEDEYGELLSIYRNEGFWDISSIVEDVDRSMSYLRWLRKQTLDYEAYKPRRRRSSAYIQRRDVRQAIFDRDKHRCKKCKCEDDLTIDHIISVKNGGDNSDENLQVLCRSCNSKKGGK